MNSKSCCPAVVDFRLKRKCFIPYESFFMALLLPLLMMGIKSTYCRPPKPYHNTVDQLMTWPDHNEYTDADNVEIHHVKLINGTFEADHPIIMYKEDFVDENYEKSSNFYEAGNANSKLSTEQYRTLPPEKIYFDILQPLHLYKQAPSNIRLVPLSEDVSISREDSKEDGKERLRNAKFERNKHRSRRSTNYDHQQTWDTVNPFLRYYALPSYFNDIQNYRKKNLLGINTLPRIPAAGKKHNALDIPVAQTTTVSPVSFDNRIAADENDRVIFSSGPRTTSSPIPTRRPPESIFRNPNPEHFDYSFMNPIAPPVVASNNNMKPPATRRPPESIFRNPKPPNFDFSFMNLGSQNNNVNIQSNIPPSQEGMMMISGPAAAEAAAAVITTPAPPRAAAPTLSQQARPTAAPRRISQCVWAIVNCCSNFSNEIRYNCFERNGCYGAFWGLNPCADNIRDNVISYVAG